MPAPGLHQRVEATPGNPLPYGLLSVATVIPSIDPHEMMGVDWEPLTCGQVFTTDWCPPGGGEGEDEDLPKEFQRHPVISADPVTTYYGTNCPPFGESLEDARNRATTGLLLGEQKALEQWVMFNLLAPQAVDRTPAGGASIPQGLSILERWLGMDYGGVGVIHAPVGLASWFGNHGLVLREGNRNTSWSGNSVAFGAGYELNVGPGDSGVAPEGFAWLYATGPVILRRESNTTTLPTNESESVNIVTNDRVILAERTWVPGVECAVEAVLVELTCC